MQVFMNDWADGGLEAMIADFEITEADINGEVLLASYTYENYSGEAAVIFRRDETFYEVHAGHCSCFGLEGQWEPEESSIEELRHRCIPWEYDSELEREFKAYLTTLLNSLVPQPE